MEVRAIAKYVRVQPRKVRIIADEVRGTNAIHTAGLLRYHTSKGAKALLKVLASAMANAQENHGISPDQLKIATIMVDEGPRLKRMQARAMGRGNRIIKKTSHITVVVEDGGEEVVIRPHGTKAKPRPTLSSGPRGKKAKAAVVVPTAEVTPTEETKVESVEETVEPVEISAESTTPVTETGTIEAEASEDQGAQ
jgi:large subunit ribosomal protein L22